MKRLLLFVVTLSVLLVYGCVKPVSYDLSMKPNSDSLVDDKMHTEDGISFLWNWINKDGDAGSGYDPILSISNKSGKTIRIVWNDSTVVVSGRPHPIFHYGSIPLYQVNGQLLRDSIIPNNSINAFTIARADGVRHTQNFSIVEPILHGIGIGIQNVGDQIVMNIAIDNGERKEYSFVFTIENVTK